MRRPEHVSNDVRDAQKSALCSRCAAICCRLGVILVAEDAVPETYVERLASGTAQLRRDADGWCAALDRPSMSCSIYEQRPQTCRRFAMGGVYCMDERKRWAGNLRLAQTPIAQIAVSAFMDPATLEREAVAESRKGIQRGDAENAELRGGIGVRFPRG